MMEARERLLGIYPHIIKDATDKRLIEAQAGRGGIEALLQFVNKLDWLEEIRMLKAKIKAFTEFFESALSFCTKDRLSRPVDKRFEEIFEFMGFTCLNCGLKASLQDRKYYHGSCPKCGQPLTSLYVAWLKKAVNERISIKIPETVLMCYAYDMLAQAFVDTYRAFGEAIMNIAKNFGWEAYRLDQRIDSYMDSYHYGRLAGEQKISREEKECLQFLARGNIAGIPIEEAEKLLRLGINVVKYGYLHQVLNVAGADARYMEAATSYTLLYDELSMKIRESKHSLVVKTATRFKFKRGGGYYAPCFKIAKANWQSGQFSGEIVLAPYYLPVFTKADMVSVQTVYGRQGSGKTFLLSSIICYAYYKNYETILVPLNDKTNSYSLAALPFFAYSKNTAKLLQLLDMLDVKPQGIPTITVNVLQRGEAIEDYHRHPPTIYDRILEVTNPANFTVNFNELMKELKAEAENHGLSVPAGMIVFRNLQRETKDYYVDVEVATNVILEFDKWRKGHMGRPMRLVLDEVSYMAASHAITYASDKLTAGATITDFIKEARRNNVSVDAATQLPIEIMRELRNAATNVFFRNLQSSKDKMRSPIDYLLECIQLRDEALKPIIRDINNRGALPKGFWFWYNQPSYDINVIRPAPPTFCIYDPEAEMSPMEILTEYEKQTGQKIILESWRQVKKLTPAKSEPSPTRRGQYRLPWGYVF